MRIDLNADLGESFGAYTIGADAELLDIVTSANVACGFHASDPTIMVTVRMIPIMPTGFSQPFAGLA